MLKLHKCWHIDQRKISRVPQNLDNPKNCQTLECGWALGHVPYLGIVVNDKMECFKRHKEEKIKQARKMANMTLTGLEKVSISLWLVTLLHICGVIPTSQSPISPDYSAPISPVTPRRAPTSPHRAPMSPYRVPMSPHRAPTSAHWAPTSSHRMTSARSPRQAQIFPHRVPVSSHRMTSVSWCFTMF